jgi:subtilisin family serine protease
MQKGNFLMAACLSIFERTGGKTYGVAKDVNLVALKVFGADGKSRFSDIIAALEYVIYRKRKEPNVPMVVNMSLGTERKAMLLNTAVDKATKAGITVVVAAGNGGKNACTYSPASASSAITVAASTFEE